MRIVPEHQRFVIVSVRIPRAAAVAAQALAESQGKSISELVAELLLKKTADAHSSFGHSQKIDDH